MSACATAPTHDQATQSLTYPQGRKFTAAEQAQAAQEIEDAGCDPAKNKPQDCKIPMLLELLKDALSIKDQIAVALDKFLAAR